MEKRDSPPSSPSRSPQRTHRSSYNNWATQRRQTSTRAQQNNQTTTSNGSSSMSNGNNLLSTPPNVRPINDEVQSPDLFSPPTRAPVVNRPSRSDALHGIRQLLDDIDSTVDEDFSNFQRIESAENDGTASQDIDVQSNHVPGIMTLNNRRAPSNRAQQSEDNNVQSNHVPGIMTVSNRRAPSNRAQQSEDNDVQSNHVPGIMTLNNRRAPSNRAQQSEDNDVQSNHVPGIMTLTNRRAPANPAQQSEATSNSGVSPPNRTRGIMTVTRPTGRQHRRLQHNTSQSRAGAPHTSNPDTDNSVITSSDLPIRFRQSMGRGGQRRSNPTTRSQTLNARVSPPVELSPDYPDEIVDAVRLRMPIDGGIPSFNFRSLVPQRFTMGERGLGTQSDPVELDSDLSDVPDSPTAFDLGSYGLANVRNSEINSDNTFLAPTGRGSSGGNNIDNTFLAPTGRGSSISNTGRDSSRRRGRPMGSNLRVRAGRPVAATLGPSSLSGLQFLDRDTSPVGSSEAPEGLSDEELARRLQEEEWEAASARGLDDDSDGFMMRNLDSPLHLFGGYHRRRPPQNLPPLATREDDTTEVGIGDLASGHEDSSPFFFDIGRGRGGRGRRASRLSGPGGRNSLSSLMFLAELQRELGQNNFMLDLLTNSVAQAESGLFNFSDELNGSDDYEALLALSERIGEVSRGMSQTEINRLPTCKHKPETDTDVEGASSSPPGEPQQCHICLSEYDNGDQKRILPCKHDFHKDCVDTWLKSNATCPVCRSEVKHKRS